MSWSWWSSSNATNSCSFLTIFTNTVYKVCLIHHNHHHYHHQHSHHNHHQLIASSLKTTAATMTINNDNNNFPQPSSSILLQIILQNITFSINTSKTLKIRIFFIENNCNCYHQQEQQDLPSFIGPWHQKLKGSASSTKRPFLLQEVKSLKFTASPDQ